MNIIQITELIQNKTKLYAVYTSEEAKEKADNNISQGGKLLDKEYLPYSFRLAVLENMEEIHYDFMLNTIKKIKEKAIQKYILTSKNIEHIVATRDDATQQYYVMGENAETDTGVFTEDIDVLVKAFTKLLKTEECSDEIKQVRESLV